jgi:hypothetical protein
MAEPRKPKPASSRRTSSKSSSAKPSTSKQSTSNPSSAKPSAPKSARPAGAPASKKMTPKAKKISAAVEKEFGGAVRRAAERSGRKPGIWRETERRESREVVLNKIGSAAVQRATTRTWEEWLVTLDSEGMRGLPHRDVVQHLVRAHGLTSWWSQMVCVGYEQARGQRQVHEKPTGFEISVSRTIDASASDLFRAFNDPTRRSWSAVQDYVVRTTIAPRSLRLGMPDSTLAAVTITRKGNTRCSIEIQHSNLPDAAAADRAKSMWRDALARLTDLLAD